MAKLPQPTSMSCASSSRDNGVDFVPEGDSNEEREKLADLLPFKSDDAAAA